MRIGATQKKIIATLAAGFAFGYSRSPKKQAKILFEELPAEFSKINHQKLEYGLHRLYKNNLIGMESVGEGRYEPYLTKQGHKQALNYSLEDIKIPIPVKWDGYWRVVLFDIPEKFKKRRNLFRYHLQCLGFKEVQKSVFCFPYECGEQIM